MPASTHELFFHIARRSTSLYQLMQQLFPDSGSPNAQDFMRINSTVLANNARQRPIRAGAYHGPSILRRGRLRVVHSGLRRTNGRHQFPMVRLDSWWLGIGRRWDRRRCSGESAKRKRLQLLAFFPMTLAHMFLVVYMLLTGLAAWFGIVISANADHWLPVYGLVTATPGFAGGFLWAMNSIYIMYAVLPKVDPIVDPLACRQIQRHGDNFLFRSHRPIFYSWSTSWRFANRRMMPTYDFSRLPANLRMTLFGNYFAHISTCLLMFPGSAALILSERWGYL